eukprot:Tbor_TRINITY_DN4105_c0_g1::TRINITY_DN4105_c0_g1_i1::g.26456::m.26456
MHILNIKIQLPSKKEIELKLPEKSPVTDIFLECKKLFPAEDFSSKTCHLFYNGSRLGNNMYLDYYRFPYRAKLQLSRRLKNIIAEKSSEGHVSSNGRTNNKDTEAQSSVNVSAQEQQHLSREESRNKYMHSGGSVNTSLTSKGCGENTNIDTTNGSSVTQIGRSCLVPVPSHHTFDQQKVTLHHNSPSRPESPHSSLLNKYNISSNSPATDGPSTALHLYRIRELELQVTNVQRAHECALKRVAELEETVDRLQNIIRRVISN